MDKTPEASPGDSTAVEARFRAALGRALSGPYVPPEAPPTKPAKANPAPPAKKPRKRGK